jgi:ACS family tartrate transporter-like MFS transporter
MSHSGIVVSSMNVHHRDCREASIAWINSIGNLGGFFGPWYVGVIKDMTGSFSGGLYGLAFLCLISSIVCAFFLHIPNPVRTPTEAVGAEAT